MSESVHPVRYARPGNRRELSVVLLADNRRALKSPRRKMGGLSRYPRSA